MEQMIAVPVWEMSSLDTLIDVKPSVMVPSLLLMSNLSNALYLDLFVAVPSSTFSATNPGEEAVALQPQLKRSITGGWQKQEQLKRWEQEIEAVQPEKSKSKHQIFKLVC